jgi:hypothetical protein
MTIFVLVDILVNMKYIGGRPINQSAVQSCGIRMKPSKFPRPVGTDRIKFWDWFFESILDCDGTQCSTVDHLLELEFQFDAASHHHLSSE